MIYRMLLPLAAVKFILWEALDLTLAGLMTFLVALKELKISQ